MEGSKKNAEGPLKRAIVEVPASGYKKMQGKYKDRIHSQNEQARPT